MTSQAPTPPSGQPWEKFVFGALALLLPTGAGAAFWDFFKANPVWIVPVLLGCWALLFVVAVVTGVAERARDAVVDAVWGQLASRQRRERREYLRRLATHVEDIELAGVATTTGFAVGLRDVFIDVSLARGRNRETANSPSGVTGERTGFTDALAYSKSKVAAVIGPPGSGKTTLLRHTALRLCHDAGRKSPLPILLELRSHITDLDTVKPAAVAQLASSVGWVHGKVPAAWFEEHLDTGNCLVMLDGLDEIPTAAGRRRVAEWLKHQIVRHPGNTFVVTSRPFGYTSNPVDKADVWQVRRFTHDQIAEFLGRWYGTTEERTKKPDESPEAARERGFQRAADLINRLVDNPALYELASNPLLLTMIALVHRYRGELPGSRAALYRELCDLLLHRRRDDVGLGGHGTGLSGTQKERVARQLAKTMMEAGESSFATERAEQAIAVVLSVVDPKVTAADFLTEAAQNGLLVAPEEGTLAFAHLSLQEYLAAQAFHGESAAGSKLALKVDDPAWREVILLWAENGDATEVVESCLVSGSMRALTLAFDCANQARELAPEMRSRIESILDGSSGHDEHRRIVTSIKVSRELKQSSSPRPGEGATPMTTVSSKLYRMFQMSNAGRHHPTPIVDDSAAVGMWSQDVSAFIQWIDKLLEGDNEFRLPTTAEAASPAIAEKLTAEGHSVWTTGSLGPTLVVPEGVRHPSRLPMDLPRRYLDTDWELTSHFIAVLHLMSPLAWCLNTPVLRFDHILGDNQRSQFLRDVQQIAATLDIDLTTDFTTVLFSGLNSVHELMDNPFDVAMTHPGHNMRDGFSDSAYVSALQLTTDTVRLFQSPLAKRRMQMGELGQYHLRLSTVHEVIRALTEQFTAMQRRLLTLSYAMLLEAFETNQRDTGTTADATATGIQARFRRYILSIGHAKRDRHWHAHDTLKFLDALSERVRDGKLDALQFENNKELLAELLRCISELIRPLLLRQKPLGSHDLACARIGVSAAIAACAVSARSDHPTFHDLHELLFGLVSIEYRNQNPHLSNEVILLLRD